MQTFQVFRNAQVTIADIALAHPFRKEKSTNRAKTYEQAVSQNSRTMLLLA